MFFLKQSWTNRYSADSSGRYYWLLLLLSGMAFVVFCLFIRGIPYYSRGVPYYSRSALSK